MAEILRMSRKSAHLFQAFRCLGVPVLGVPRNEARQPLVQRARDQGSRARQRGAALSNAHLASLTTPTQRRRNAQDLAAATEAAQSLVADSPAPSRSAPSQVLYDEYVNEPVLTINQPALTNIQPALTQRQLALTQGQPALTQGQAAILDRPSQQYSSGSRTDRSRSRGGLRGGFQIFVKTLNGDYYFHLLIIT